MIVLKTGYIPPAELCGNTRQHRSPKSTLARQARKHGKEVAENNLPPGHEPWTGRIRLEVEIATRRSDDLQNLFFGYKSFLDGVQDAGLMKNDKDIEDARIMVWRDSTLNGAIFRFFGGNE